MWVDFRRKHLRFIYAPTINFLSNTLSSLRKRRYIQKMVKSFIQNLGTSKVRRIRVIYNFADSPHTFGDFMVVVMFCRFLALSGYQILLTVVDSIRRSDWIELDEGIQDQRIDELLNLAKYLLPEAIKVELVNNYLPMSSDINLDSKSFYSAAPYFLDLLITKYKWAMPASFLLKVSANETSVPYIAWHVRKASYDSRRNLTSTSIQSDFEILQKSFPGHSIMLISDSTGLEDAFLALTGSRETKTRKVRGTPLLAQPVPGFQNAIPAVLAASFYFQRGGGGIGVGPIFSSLPYLNLCPDKSYFHVRRGNRAVPWSTANQLFVYVKENVQSFPIQGLINRLKV